jgi:hypothetical protein
VSQPTAHGHKVRLCQAFILFFLSFVCGRTCAYLSPLGPHLVSPSRPPPHHTTSLWICPSVQRALGRCLGWRG